MNALRIAQVLTVVGAGLLIGCTHKSADSDSPTVTKSQYDVNKYAVNATVCDPLGGSSTPSSDPQQGIKASLWYLTSGQPIQHDVESMINVGHASSENLFFSTLNVPTRLFTEGFPLQTGGSIKDDMGNELIEYFALRFESLIQLGSDDPEGDYQFGMLSDDGTIWSLASTEAGQDYQIMLNNDGDHPTQMGCGPIVHMTKTTKLVSRIDYYQGPRYHIALVPLWRLVNSSTVSEPQCGQNGNSMYFDYNNNSVPEPAYNQMLTRGWKPLNASNYALQTSADYNPCTQGTAPVISNLALNMETFTLNWTTDIPATDQVLLTDTGTSEETLSTSDNVLRTQHSVAIPALTAGHHYSVQAVSISADLGKTISAAVAIP